MALNTNYSGLAASSMEVSATKAWSYVWTQGHPLLKILDGRGTNFNRGFSKRGKYMVLPVVGAEVDNPVDGVSDANQFNAMTLNTDDKLTQAQYDIAHYRGNYTIPATDALDNNELGNRMDARQRNLLESFKNAISGDIASSNNGTREAVLGLVHLLSTSNSPGNINQSTYANWRAQVTTGAGSFDIGLIDEAMNAVMRLDRADVDVLLAASVAGNDVYQAIVDTIAPSQRFMDPDLVKFGVKNVIYNGAAVVRDNRGTSGNVLGLSTKTWFAGIDKKPKFHEPQLVNATDGKFVAVTAFAVLGCNDPGSNFRVSGITV